MTKSLNKNINSGYNMDALLEELQNVFNTMVIKYTTKAKEKETEESRKASNEYLSCYKGYATKYTFKNYPEEVLLKAGLTEDEINSFISIDKLSLDKQKAVLNARINYTLQNYEEKNNYYRELIGLPSTEDEEFIFLDFDVYESLGLTDLVPIHKLSDYQIAILEKRGIIDELKNKYPDKKYLWFLGYNKIDLIKARDAKNFAILYVDDSIVNDFLYEELLKNYELVREYNMSVLYNKDLQGYIPYYDNFFALSIMTSTIHRLFTSTFSYLNQYNFYDLRTIKLFYDAYHIPFMEQLPFEYHKSLIKNLNYLMQYKSTNKVLEEIFNVFNNTDMIIYKYYLIKNHKLDENGNPIFKYKIDENGNKVLDKEKMYDLYFQLVDMKEQNLALSFNDLSLRESYEIVTQNDRYWVEDQRLKDKIYSSYHNCIETKYIGVVLMYKLSELLFEAQYCFNLIIDKKEEVKNFTIHISRLFGDADISIFDALILLCALLCKHQGYEGNILCTPTSVSSIYGFNLKEDIQKVINDYSDNEIVDKKLFNYFHSLDINSIDDISTLFLEIKEFKDFLINKISYCETIEEYHIYNELYKTILVTEENIEAFTKTDGTHAKTFKEYLLDSNQLLGEYVELVKDEDISEDIDLVIKMIQNAIPALEHIYSLNNGNPIILDGILKMIMFFKSYTTDVAHFYINYIFKNPVMNYIKFIDKINYMEVDFRLKNYLRFYDTIKIERDK